MNSIGLLALLGVGLLLGLKHASEVDHVVAVTTMVSEDRNFWRSSFVGGLWGVGHSISLLLVGTLVLALRVAIPVMVTRWLEFGVGLMIIGLGISALVGVIRRRGHLHVHQHSHDGQSHVHIHFHDEETKHSPEAPHNHAITQVGVKPLIVGAVHGLAGSAALTLLLLTQIESMWLGLGYLLVFGIGSTVGMLLMSSLISLPFVLAGHRLSNLSYGLQAITACLSVAFGCWYAYRTASSALLW